MAKISAKQALESKTTFYVKMWQGNGYYPTYKFEYDKEKNLWSEWRKIGKVKPEWVLYGKQDYDFWEYFFEHNTMLISDKPMYNKKQYNYR